VSISGVTGEAVGWAERSEAHARRAVALPFPDRAHFSTTDISPFNREETFGPELVRGWAFDGLSPRETRAQLLNANLRHALPDDRALIDLLAQSIAAETAAHSDAVYETRRALRELTRGIDLWAMEVGQLSTKVRRTAMK
jgi:hypothetical protein